MNPTRDAIDWEEVERLFCLVRERPVDDRDTLLRELAQGDPRLREEVRVLLAHDLSDAFLEAPGDMTLLAYLAAAGAPPDDLGGHLLLRQYELGALIGSGSDGAVYHGVDRFTRESVAVKVLGHREPSTRVRFELACLRLLRVPGVVALLDDGDDERLGRCLVLEHVQGEPFGAGPRPVPWAQVRKTTLALLATLTQIHARGLVHKDLKPANVLVDADGNPTVLDLGMSGMRPGPEDGAPKLVGTPAYMAPEVVRGAAPDERADLHAVGLMAFEALSGRRLFDASHARATLLAKQGMLRRQLHSWLAYRHTPPEARRLLRALLDPDPDRRPQRAQDACALLDVLPHEFRHEAVTAGTELGLRRVFRGLERALHIPSDAAHELFKRTGGEPEQVQAELDAWEAAGLGHWDAAGFQTDRPSIGRLRAGFEPHVPTIAPPVPPLPAGGTRVLALVRLLSARTPIRTLIDATELEEAAVRETVAILHGTGFIEHLEPDAVRLTARGQALPLPADGPAHASRLADAWPLGTEGRLELLSQAGRNDEIAAEALRAVETAFRTAYPEDGVRLAELGLRMRPGPGIEHALLFWLLRMSIPLSAAAPIERALSRIERSGLPTAQRRPLEQIARAALFSVRGQIDRAEAALPPRPPPEGESIRLLDLSVRTQLIRHLGAEEAELRTRALHGPEERAVTEVQVSAWGWLRLRQGRYAEAASHYRRQAALAPNRQAALNARSNLLNAMILACRWPAARTLGEQLLSAASKQRVPHIEVRAAHDLRRIRYALGEYIEADPELTQATQLVGLGRLIERAHLTEAAIAWRAARREEAREHARAACVGLRAGRDGASVNPVARAFYRYLAPDESPDDGARLARSLDQIETPDDLIETIGLMALCDTQWVHGLADRFARALAQIPPETSRHRRLVLSVDEAVEAVVPVFGP